VLQQHTEDDARDPGAGGSAKRSGSEDWRSWKHEDCRTTRHRERERAETRKGLVRSIVVSCSTGGWQRWGTELDLGSRESLDDYHGPTALGAEPEIVRVLGGGSLWLGGWC
jgi:hypothetical protein